jgi:aryl-alcohol dehydrogenase-like predicted oxidoreductase
LAWLLQRSPAMLPIPGTSSLDHLEQNVAAAGLTLSPTELDELTAAAAPSLGDRLRAVGRRLRGR